MRVVPGLTLLVLATLMLLPPRDDLHFIAQEQQLPKIAPAPGFMLTSRDGAQISLADLRGKVVAVTFIFTSCTATCPVLTSMMSSVQDQLGPDFGNKVVFASITVDPE